MATVIISAGIVSSRDISVPITFTAGNATGIAMYVRAYVICSYVFVSQVRTYIITYIHNCKHINLKSHNVKNG